MQNIDQEIASFREARERFAETSRQTAALQLLCGIDLSEVLGGSGKGEDDKRIIRTIRRAMERERLRGFRGQAGYDLDRHIALKRSLDRLGGAKPSKARAGYENGARRRRSTVTTAA